MHPLYTEKYFRNYLLLSIDIFHKQYQKGTSYLQHDRWPEFLKLLREAGVSRILISEGMMIGDISVQYTHHPITENSPSEDDVRSKSFVVEEIVL